MRRLDLTGQRFGRLAVVAFERVNQRRNACWLCRCDDGNEVVVSGTNLRSGNTLSCGCLKLDLASKHGHAKRGSRTAEHHCWTDMLQRCTNPKHKDFADYGGRGITVCDHWKIFENFLADVGPKPSPDLTIERENNDLGYFPGNCKWATRSEQNKNQRRWRKAA